MKCTIGFLVLAAAFPVMGARLKLPRGLEFLLIPPVVVLGISMLSGLNIGLRHVLPLFPFLILLTAATAMNLASRSRPAAWAVAVLVLAHAVSSLAAYPNYLTYANEIAGGPPHAYRVMSNANVDWGQGLKQAALYLRERRVTDCWFANNLPLVDPGFYQIPCKPLPGGQTLGRIAPDFPSTIDGTILISTNQAAGQAWGPDELNPYKQFLLKTPDDIIGNSILVFHGSFDVSLASAYSHAARARQLVTQKSWDEALKEAKKAMQLFPDSADVQATLCQALTQTNRREEAQPVCESALSLARRVHAEYQFLHVPSVRAIAGPTN
ncbi:MAG: tetratricopeptide repeat protein [Acidobacteriota bacterium]